MHAQQLSEHGGRAGVRDEKLLESALARPQQTWSYADDVDLAGLAADYAFGIARNHPFINGNKRTVFVAMNVFLMLNGHAVETSEPEVVDAMLRLAGGEMDRDGFAAWLRGVLTSNRR